MERVGHVARLYQLVHRRRADADGLAAYVRALREGRPLAALAADFLNADEFTGRVAAGDETAEIWRNAGQPDGLPAATGCLAEDLAHLVTCEAVIARLPLVPMFYPDGVPLSDAAGYRLWLAQRRPMPPAGSRRVTFVMAVTREVPRAHVVAAVASVLGQHGTAELVVVCRHLVPRWLRAMLHGKRGVTLHATLPWCRTADMVERGVALASGECVAVIGADTVLDPSAAAYLAASQADIVLADDDLLGTEGRHSPRFGSAWDPDRVREAGTTGLVAMRTGLARQVGAENRLLRAAALTEPARIAHLPEVLLSRRGSEAAVRPARIIYALPNPPPRLSVIIPTRDRADLLRACTAGLLHRTDYPDLELVIVDNGSAQPEAVRLLSELDADRRVRVLAQPGPFNWSALNNAGVAAMQGEVAVLLNNDIEVIEPGWLREMAAQAIRPEVGAVGAKLLYPDGRVQHAGVVLGPHGRGTHVWRFSAAEAPGYLDQLRVLRRVTAVTGACLAIRRVTYQQAGGCDEALPVTWNDVDLCLRVRRLGLQVVWTPYARLIHREQASRGSDDTPERQASFRAAEAIMRTRWGDALDRDPFWSPHLRPAEGPDEIEPRLAID